MLTLRGGFAFVPQVLASPKRSGPMLTRPERLSTPEFDAAFGASRSLRDGLLILRVHWRTDDAQNDLCADLRAAFVVPKKLGKAVWRNRTRRRMREAFRLGRERLQVLAGRAGSCDCIFLAQARAHDAGFEALQSSIESLLSRAVQEHLKQRGSRSGSAATREISRASGA